MQVTLHQGQFVRRWKRFLSEVRLPDGQLVTAHVPNSGSMATLNNPGCRCWLRHDPSPKRKLAWTLVLMETSAAGLAVVDTMLPNRMVGEALAAGAIAELTGYATIRSEATLPNLMSDGKRSRFDFLLSAHTQGLPECVVEVKNVTMAATDHPTRADFPDAVSVRGAKHLDHLRQLRAAGYRCVQFYLLNRTDCTAVGIHQQLDSGYARALLAAQAAGVEVLAYRSAISDTTIALSEACPFIPPIA